MKKPPHKPAPHRKLVVRSEAIATLTPPQLTKVVGAEDGCSYWDTCRPPGDGI